MTSIQKTIYPRFGSNIALSAYELEAFYTLTSQEKVYLCREVSDSEEMQLSFAVQLKCFQRLNYFPKIKSIPKKIIQHIRNNLKFSRTVECEYSQKRSLYRHRKKIRDYLHVTPWFPSSSSREKKESLIHQSRRFAIKMAYQFSETQNFPADIINAVIETMIKEKYELPSFDTLDRLVKHVRSRVNGKIFQTIFARLKQSPHLLTDLNSLMEVPSHRSVFNGLKKIPKRPSITHLRTLLVHYNWLMGFEKMSPYLKDVAKIKREHFANEARSLTVSEISEMQLTEKKHALLVCLVDQAQRSAKDSLVLTFQKIVNKMHKSAKTKLANLREKHQEMNHSLLRTFSDILLDVKEFQQSQEQLIKKIMGKIDEGGGAEELHQNCAEVMAYVGKNHFPLLWNYFKDKRSALIKLLKVLNIRSITEDDNLIRAMKVMLEHSNKKSEYIDVDLDLSFISEPWLKMVVKKEDKKILLRRRYFEMCVISYLNLGLHSIDVYVEGSRSFESYKKDLKPWKECEEELEEYCRNLHFPSNKKEFVAFLKKRLMDISERVDSLYPECSEVTIQPDGKIIIKDPEEPPVNQTTLWLAEVIRQRLPRRTLLDILCSAHHYTGWAHVFGPLSGSESKMSRAIERYIFTTFTFATCMGPTQAANHVKAEDINEDLLSRINRKHVTPELLDKAMARLVNFYKLFPLIKVWGDGSRVISDGSMRHIREENLLAEYHFRYLQKGGVVYTHISDNYLALFSTFIPCGLWEAVEILEPLIRNISEVQPKIIHADTQGQSSPVFGLASLLGIELMPRIRNWRELKFFRADKKIRYRHIDKIFSETINWKLIETYWQEMMQVVLSIKAGKMNSASLLRQLGNYSRKNRLYRAFCEVGRVIRTEFLLNYLSSSELRQIINESTNKIESYHTLMRWTSFGATELVASNDEKEMEKAVKYNAILNNSIMIQNVIDVSNLIYELKQEGHIIREKDAKGLSPYLTAHLNRFGLFFIDLKGAPRDIGKSQHVRLD